MGLVEGVVGEIIDLLIDGLSGGLRNAIGNTACNSALRVAVNEGVLLPLNLGRFLLGDGPAHHVSLSQRIAGQLLENLNDLLLIDNTAIGDRENRFQ